LISGRDLIGGGKGRRLAAAIGLAAAVALIPSFASAHIERASYWPDPGVDFADGQPAGGAVPDARNLFSALDTSQPGTTRVVCQGAAVPAPALTSMKKLRKKRKQAKANGQVKKVRRLTRKIKRAKKRNAARQAAWQRAVGGNPSMSRLEASLADAVANGYKIRPSEPPIPVSQAEANALRDFNARLLAECRYDSIQAAVNASGNNDRVVIMSGVYDEPASRAAPTHDPACDGLEEENDRGQTGALSYKYQVTCPNDQNLVAVIGRAPGPSDPPQPPALDRHGVPDNGACIRCNLQLEGSGVSADDVVVDAGRVASGNGAPPDPVKDIAIRVERADGFVLRNITARHAAEHGIYVVETDGYRLERFKVFYNEEYGLLTFTGDHVLIQDCEAVGAGDAGLYPGSAADTGEQRKLEVNPDYRLNTELRRCDMHHNMLGYSGTAANAVWIHNNDFYDNSLGLVTDVITAAGHPGFPQDSDLIENNEFYSNNFNPYVEQPPETEVVPTLPIPVGTAMWILGGNNNEFRNNYVWDNWRRGVMLSSVNDALVCGDNPIAGGNQQAGCNPNAPPEQASTSYRNRFHDNVMGRSPDGVVAPNGSGNVAQGRTDFWWDQWLGSNTNCWYDNVGKDGTAGSLTTTPAAPFLPSSCDPLQSTGTGGPLQDAEVYECFVVYIANDQEVDGDGPVPHDACPWFQTPAKPEP